MEWDICLKNVNKHLFDFSSIRTRLTFFYTLAVFVVLTIIVLILYWTTIHLLYKADYEFLADEVDTIQYILEKNPINEIALKEAVVDAPLSPEGSIYRYFIRILDNKKNLLIETPGTKQVLQNVNNLHKSSEFIEKKRFFWYENNDSKYLLIQAPIMLGKKSSVGFVQIALDITYQHSIIHDRNKLIYALLAGTLFALILGIIIAKRGLRSLYLLTDTVQKITATSLDNRIDPTSWPKELSGLGNAFNQMLDRMETSFSRLKQFSADLSHELRTPITNMIGQTEIALTYEDNVAEYRKAMESNLEELQRMSSLVENILFLAKAENPQLDLQKKLIHAHDEIALICEFYQAIADEKDIKVKIDGQADLHANPIMFRRLISNILSNALKYSPEHREIYFNISEVNDSVQITARDQGDGIAPEHLLKIFDRFYRVDSARAQKTGGIGLGLAIVKSIVDMHHGRIAITSELNSGTTISIHLPK